MPGTHGPIDPLYHEQMKKLARLIDQVFNGEATGEARTTGFALLIFPFGLRHDKTDRVNYLSNADRSDMLTAMKEFIARAEGRHPEETQTGVSSKPQ